MKGAWRIVRKRSSWLIMLAGLVSLWGLKPNWLGQSLTTGQKAQAAPAEETASPLSEVGAQVADFELPIIATNEKVLGAAEESSMFRLEAALEKSPVVLVLLRGFPGYQCPLCSRQVLSFTDKADALQEAKVQVVLVYPGPKEGLADRAREFLENIKLPEPFTLLIDPGMEQTSRWKLRWDEANETSYPATFVIDRAGKLTFVKISQSHGDRAEVGEVLKSLAQDRKSGK